MSESAKPLLLVEINDGVALVTINRPEAMNALNQPIREEITRAATELDANKDVRVVVITGAGDRAFCAGADLKERQKKSTEEMYQTRRQLYPKWVNVIANITKPTIAAVRGYCLAGGVELMLQCDIAIAADNSVFSLPEVTIGFMPGGGACQRLPRVAGLAKAKELIFTGRRFSAQEAESIGLVMRLVPSAEVLDEAMKLARAIAKNPPVSVIQAKIALNASQETTLAAGLRFENEAWLSCMLSDVWKSKLQNFVSK